MIKLVLATITVATLGTSCGLHSHGSSRTFRATSRYAVGAAPGAVVVADLNGDNRPDIVVANEQSNNASVLLGDGHDGFTPALGSPFPAGASPNDIAVADFNRDGKPDLAFANHGEKHLTVLLGDGSGAFTPAPRSPFAVEVKPHTHGVAAGDFNGDGNPDLLTDSWGTDQVELLFSDGKGGFTLPGTLMAVGKHPYQRVRVADLNDDAHVDIITTNLEGDNVTVLLGDGKGGFRQAPGSPFACGDSPFNFAIGDVNGDAKPDLAVVDSPSSTSDRTGKDGLTILLSDGKGSFTAMTGSPFNTGRMPNMVAIGDINGDGVGDVAVSEPESDMIREFLMSKNNSVASTIPVPVGGKPKGLALYDLNGDGNADIVVSNSGEQAVTVMLTIIQRGPTPR